MHFLMQTKVIDKGFEVFLDLKYHDIPNTVAAACEAGADLGVWMMNVHAAGGRKMMETAANRLAKLQSRPLLIAVTILTSLSADEVAEIGYPGSPQENVSRFKTIFTEYHDISGGNIYENKYQM